MLRTEVCACPANHNAGALRTFFAEYQRCRRWFHGECYGVSEADCSIIAKYFCQACLDEYSALSVEFLKVDQLRSILRNKHLSTCGTKAVLQDRLKRSYVQDERPLATAADGHQSPTALVLNLSTSKQRILDRLPKASRCHVACLLACLIEDVADSNSEESYLKLFAFATTCLRSPGNRKSRNSVSLATAVNRQIADFHHNWKASFLPDRPTPTSARNSSSAPPIQVPDIASRVSSKISQGDVKGAVRIISSVETIAAPCPELVEVLKNKHPSQLHHDLFPPSHVEDNPAGDEQFSVDIQGIRRAILSFRGGSGAGPDKLKPQRLKDMIQAARTSESLERDCYWR